MHIDRARMQIAVVVAMTSTACGLPLDIGDFDDTSAGDATPPDDDGDPGATAPSDDEAPGDPGGDDPTSAEGGNESGDDPTTSGAATDTSESTEGEPIVGPPCDPLVQDCPAGEPCAWAGATFRCLDAGIDAGLGQWCDAPNDCAVGLQCVAPEDLGCDGSEPGCCASFCDLAAGDANCEGDTVCVPWFDGGAPPGLESVGTCRLDDGGDAPAECDGLAQDCEPGMTCVPVDNFECLPAGLHADGEPCVGVGDCQVGLYCAPWDTQPDCLEADVSCCTPLCMLDVERHCQGAATTCSALPGAPLPDNEDVGYCTL